MEFRMSPFKAWSLVIIIMIISGLILGKEGLVCCFACLGYCFLTLISFVVLEEKIKEWKRRR